MKKFFIIFLTTSIMLLLFACANPTPSISSISPTAKVTHMPTFTLTTFGSGFIEESTIVFNGVEKETTFASETELTCEISPDDTVLTALTKTSTAKISQTETNVPVFVSNPSPGGGDSESVNFTIRDNHTFTTPIQVASSLSNAQARFITLDSNGILYLIIRDDDCIIYLTTSENNGDTWSGPERLTDPGSKSYFGRIYVDNTGNIHFFYANNKTGKYQIYYRRKTAGEGWEAPLMLSEENIFDKGQWLPKITVSGENIYVFWHKYDKYWMASIMMAHSSNSGTNWSTPRELTSLGQAYNFGSALITETGSIFFAYNNYKQSPFSIEVKISSSSDNGVTWSTPKMISNSLGESWNPCILYPGTGQDISVVWFYRNWGSSSPEPEALISSPLFKDFTSPLSPPFKDSNIISDSPVPPAGSYQLQMAGSQDLGETWSGISTFYTYLHFRSNYTLSVITACDSAGNFNLAWYDGPDENNFRIYYMRSIDNGDNWTDPLKLWSGICTYTSHMITDPLGNIYLPLYDNTSSQTYLPYFCKSVQ